MATRLDLERRLSNEFPHIHAHDKEGSESDCGSSDVEEPVQGVADGIKRLWTMAGPLLLQNFLAYGLHAVSQGFIGHLGSAVDMSSFALASSIFNVTGSSVLMGIASAMDTLCGQAYGAKNYRLVGITLQKALAICLLLCLPVAGSWFAAPSFLSLLQQPPAVVDGASFVLRLLIPALFALAVTFCMDNYLRAQRVVAPMTVATMVTTAICPGVYWLFLYRWKLGLLGVALALDMSELTNLLVVLSFSVWRDTSLKGSSRQTWFGLSWQAFSGWGTYLALCLPATAMVCAEWWVYEIIIMLAGSLPDSAVSIAAQSCLLTISILAYMVPSSIASALTTLVANALGGGDARSARSLALLGVVLVTLTQSALSAALLLEGRAVLGVLTSVREVLDAGQSCTHIVAACLVADGLSCIIGGVLRACGRQSLGATLQLCSFWLVGLPLAALLGLHLRWGLTGFWLALLTASALQATVLLLVLLTATDWHQQVKAAAAMVASHQGEVSVAEFAAEEEQTQLTQPLIGP